MRESVSEKVQDIIADALYVDKEDVHPGANLMKDLGAESIDFLDIIFRLEKEFDIKLPRGEIERKARGNLSEEEFAIDGRLQDAGLARVREMMPEIDADNFKPGLYLRDLPTLFTVETFTRMVVEASAGTSTANPQKSAQSANQMV